MMCLAHQLSCGHDQSVDMEGAQLFVRAAFVARMVGGCSRSSNAPSPDSERRNEA